MSKKHYIVVFLLVAVALVASLWLMPKSQEVALMQMKDKHFDEARAAYEAQLEAGNLSSDVATQLSELYLQIGAIDKAIEVMEKFVALHPDNIEARKKLGTYYQYAQRNDDYLRNLEEINKLNPKPENLKTLSDIYNFNTQYEKQAETLKELVSTEKGSNPQHYIDMANIYASKKSYPEAISVLQELRTAHPDSFQPEHEELLVTLLYDDNRASVAAEEAQTWIKAHPDSQGNARLIAVTHFRGSPEAARALMAGFTPEQIASDAGLLEQDILLQLAEGKEDEAYARLKALHDAGSISPELNHRLMVLALQRDEIELAREIIDNTELKSLSEQQLVSLAELASAQDQRWLLDRITATFPDSEYRDTYPVLMALVAVANHRPDTDQKLLALEATELSAAQELQIASICSRYKKYECTGRFLGRLPEDKELSDAQVAGVGNLYLDMKQWEKGQAFITRAGAGRTSPEIDRVATKFAAARGDTQAVEAWLAAHPDASATTAYDLFFAALNNKKLVTAVAVGEFANEKFPGSRSRSYLSQAYLQTGQYADAVTLLRANNPMTEDDENNYVAALGRLAPRNTQYREELTRFAEDRLHSNISKKQKLALVYALINAKQIDVAMPTIRELALSEGGQWAALYASTLDKQGKYAEARDFWVTVANQPDTSAKDKRDIAYTLLDRGFTNDAEHIFANLAAGQKADSKDVKALLYLWGPRPDERQMSWIESRFTHAGGADRDAWGSVIANSTGPDGMEAFVERHPESLDNSKILSAYMSALVANGHFADKEAALLARAEASKDSTQLRAFAKTARENGANRSARRAYDELLAQSPNDAEAKRELGLVAFSQADYGAAERSLGEYIDGKPDDAKAYQAYFYYGELLRRNAQAQDAKAYYREAISHIDAKGDGSAEALSLKAQSQIWLGETGKGLATFEAARAAYPADQVLMGDQAAALIELKRFDDARTLLAANEPQAKAGNALAPAAGGVRSYSLLNRDSELLITFASAAKHSLSPADFNRLEGVAYANEGYDTLLVAAEPGYIFTVDTSADTPQVALARDINAPATGASASLRRELLVARADLESGHVYEASTRLNRLLAEHPRDPQLLGFTANAENYGGNWPQAQYLLKTARALAPENDDLWQLDRDMRRLNAPNVKLDHEWVKRGNDHENISTLSGFADATDNLQFGAVLQNDHVQAKNERRADGRVGNFNANRQRGELYALYHRENGQRGKFSLFANNDTLGGGATFGFFNPLGDTELTAEFHRPYWEYVPGTLDDATRDRIGLMHTIKPTQRLTIDGGPGINRYNVDGTSDVATMASVDLDIVYRLLDQQPFVAIGYGLDAEYDLNHKKSVDANGAYSRLFPLTTREVHFFSVNAGWDFSADTYGDLLLGYGWDRFGGNGPAIQGRLTHEFDEDYDAQIRAFYGIDNSGNTNNNVTRLGGYVRRRF